MRVAERDALDYRDFMERLDGITELDDLPFPKTPTGQEVSSQRPTASTIESHAESGTSPPSPSAGGVERDGVVRVGLLREQNACSEDREGREPGCVGRTKSGVANAMVDSDDADGGDGVRNGESTAVTVATAGAGEGLGVLVPMTVASHGERAANSAGGNARVEVEVSPYAHALQVAQQASLQLRKELSSLESQREALCARSSQTWSALAELAYARGVLGDECRELLRGSREVGVFANMTAANHLFIRTILSHNIVMGLLAGCWRFSYWETGLPHLSSSKIVSIRPKRDPEHFSVVPRANVDFLAESLLGQEKHDYPICPRIGILRR